MNFDSINQKLDRILMHMEKKLDPEYYSLNQIVQMTSLSSSTIHRAIRQDQLKCSRRTGRLLFKKKDVFDWLDG